MSVNVYLFSWATILLNFIPIQNVGALGFFEEGRLNKKNKMSSDLRSFPDPKIHSRRIIWKHMSNNNEIS